MTPMPPRASQLPGFRVHLTNIAGTGAVQLAASLLPALERVPGYRLEAIDLPDRGEMAGYRRATAGAAPIRYRRVLPNPLSRALECLWPSRSMRGGEPMLVLGDLPLRRRGPQAVFVQTTHLTADYAAGSLAFRLKLAIARALFRAACGYAQAFIVQSEAMHVALVRAYPRLIGKVHVVAQPVPQWLLASGLRRHGRRAAIGDRLKLFYPSAPYPHKNHRLLNRIEDLAADWPIQELVLTIAPDANPHPRLAWIRCVGALGSRAMVDAYAAADALLFLSDAESYGFPLVEAMWIGMPVVCPDLPYARTLCGDTAIYFRPGDIESLRRALLELKLRLADGWWPDWSVHLGSIPRDWNAVADAMLEVLFDPRRSARAGPGSARHDVHG